MNFIGVQLILVPFAIFQIYVAFIHYKKGHILKTNFIFWMMLWISFMILTIFPQILNPIVRELHFVRALDLLMIIAFMILVVMNYHTFLSQQKLERQVEKLIDKMTVITTSRKKT